MNKDYYALKRDFNKCICKAITEAKKKGVTLNLASLKIEVGKKYGFSPKSLMELIEEYADAGEVEIISDKEVRVL